MMKKITFLLLILCPSISFSQTWTNYTNDGQHINDILFDGQEMWMATNGGLLHYPDVSDLNSFRKYTSVDGLYSSSANCLAKSADGNIYAGTHTHGVFILEGDRWQPIAANDSLKNKHIMSLHALKNGDLLIGEAGRLQRLTDGKIVDELKADGRKVSQVHEFYETPDGKLWTRSNGGAGEFDGEKWIFHSPLEPPKGWTAKLIFYNSKNETIIVGTKSVMLYKKGEWSELFSNRDKNYGLIHSAVWDGEVLWLSDGAGRILRLYGDDFSRFLPEINLEIIRPNKDVKTMKSSPDGKVWISYSMDRTFIISGEEHEILTLNKIAGHISFSTGLVDDAGNVWFGTSGGGISKYNGDTWKIYSLGEDRKANQIYKVVFEPNDEPYAATRKGLFRFNNNEWKPVITGSKIDGKIIWDIYNRGNEMWVTSEVGISKLENGSWIHYHNNEHGLGNNKLSKVLIYEDWNSNLRFGKHDGKASTIYNGKWEVVSTDENNPLTKMLALKKSQHGDWWLLALDGRHAKVYKKTDDGWQDMDFPKEMMWQYFRKITVLENDVWVSTTKGAFRYKDNKWGHYTVKDGLTSDQVSDIFEDKNGKIWFATSGGPTTLQE